ncbi:MAG: hypothetical protein WC816_00525 [Sphingomonas sp.]|jgi:hypothetical protein
MAKKGVKLGRVLRVRTLQLNLKLADEVRARDQVTSEHELRHRIRQLSEAVAPAPSATEAFSFIAAAHFRERLHQTASATEHRVYVAEKKLETASEATREARRDQSAIEKLIERDAARDAVKAIRALEEAPSVRRNRHDPC